MHPEKFVCLLYVFNEQIGLEKSYIYYIVYTALKITFENLPIIKIKAVEKKSPTMVRRQENFFEMKILSLSGLVCKRYRSVLSHAFHDFFKRK